MLFELTIHRLSVVSGRDGGKLLGQIQSGVIFSIFGLLNTITENDNSVNQTFTHNLVEVYLRAQLAHPTIIQLFNTCLVCLNVFVSSHHICAFMVMSFILRPMGVYMDWRVAFSIWVTLEETVCVLPLVLISHDKKISTSQGGKAGVCCLN